MILRRAVALALTVTLVVAGCGTADAPPPGDPDPDETAETEEDDEDEDDPADRRLRWNIGPTPDHWTRLSTEAETVQYMIDDTACVITFFSRTDIDRDSVRTRDDVYAEFAERLGDMIGTHLTYDPGEARLIPTHTDSGDETVLQFDHVRLSGHPGIEGDLYVHMLGSNSLAVTTMCGMNEFPDISPVEFEPFLDEHVSVDATF